MNSNLFFDFSIDERQKTITVIREFAAAQDMVWQAWTNPEVLDKWWAPKPYVTRTKSFDFGVGGTWLYAMIGPDGNAHWCKADYEKIDLNERFIRTDAFCDEEGNPDVSFPRSTWTVVFEETDTDRTKVTVTIAYKEVDDLRKIIELGFREGFTMALGNLDDVLEQRGV